MQNMFNMYSVWTSITDSLSVGPFHILNHILQALFFSLAISNLVGIVLHQINFAYAEDVAHSRLVQLVGIILLWYIKIWQYYSGVLNFISVFSLIFMCIYVYDSCGNITEYFMQFRMVRRQLVLLLCFLGMFLSTFGVYWALTHSNQPIKQYEYSGIYAILLVVICVGHVLRNRSMLFALVGILVMNYIIASRYLLQQKISHKLFAHANIPLTLLPIFMMSLDAEKRERERTKSDSYSWLFKFCISISAFSILNASFLPLQLILGGVFVFALIINR